jgi:hypothetical protein
MFEQLHCWEIDLDVDALELDSRLFGEDEWRTCENIAARLLEMDIKE